MSNSYCLSASQDWFTKPPHCCQISSCDWPTFSHYPTPPSIICEHYMVWGWICTVTKWFYQNLFFTNHHWSDRTRHIPWHMRQIKSHHAPIAITHLTSSDKFAKINEWPPSSFVGKEYCVHFDLGFPAQKRLGTGNIFLPSVNASD